MTENKADPLREALEPFAALAEHISEKHHDSRPIIYAFDGALTTRLTIGDLRRAKAALAAPQPAASLAGRREAIARIVDPGIWGDDPDVGYCGCHRCQVDRDASLAKADAILAAIPQERGVERDGEAGTIHDEVQAGQRCRRARHIRST